MKWLRRLKQTRWYNHLYALTHAHFWLPCRLCGRMYGGHEEHGRLLTSLCGGYSVCINCADEAETRNRNLLGYIPRPAKKMVIYSTTDIK